MTVQSASEFYRNSPGIITENTESFTYHDVVTPLRAYRLTADNNLVRHIYEQVKRGSVVATYSDEEGNKLADDVNVKTNEYEGEDYQTEAKTIRPTYEYDTVNGLTKTTITRYELIKTPENANGKVVAETTITVPYVYRKVVTVDIKGSVIATYKDEEGTILASEEKVITNQNAGTYYAAASKQIQAATSSKETEHGRKVTVITYELIKTPDNETGEVVANPSTRETVNPKEKVIRVGTKPKVDVEKVARKVTYLADATKDFGFTEVKTEGSDGSVTTTTTYTVNEDGSVSPNTPTKEVVEAVTKIVVMGTKPKVTVEKTNYTTSYEEDGTLTKGETKVKVQGKEGVKTTTITYTLDTELGVVKENKPTVEEVEVVNEIISVGTKPEESSEPIPYTTEYRPNTQVEKGETSVKTKGENGKTTTTVTYKVDKTTGKVTEKDRKVDIVSPKNEVVEIGNKPTTEVVVIPSVVRYVPDTSKKVGSDNETTKGKDGSKSTTTTYNVDPKTGKITEVVGIPVITDQVETVVKVGAKPKEETSENNDGQNNNESENVGKAETNHEDKKRSGQGEYIVPSFFEQNLE